MKTLSFISLFFFAITAFCAEINSVPEQPVTDELIVYERGNMPVIILAPHDGTAKPAGMPLKKNRTRDVFSSELARQSRRDRQFLVLLPSYPK